MIKTGAQAPITKLASNKALTIRMKAGRLWVQTIGSR